MNKTYSNITFAADKLCMLRDQRLLFENLSFAITNGQVLKIEGGNGSGKTTLLRILAGLTEASAGQVLFNNHRIHPAFFAEHCHYIGHANSLQLDLTVKENLNCFLNLGLHTKDDATLNAILADFQLQQYAHQRVRHLSAGQRRKVALARLKLLPRPLWLLDEPLVSLDQTSQTILLAALSAHQQQGGIAILATHQALPLTNNTLTVQLC